MSNEPYPQGSHLQIFVDEIYFLPQHCIFPRISSVVFSTTWNFNLNFLHLPHIDFQQWTWKFLYFSTGLIAKKSQKVVPPDMGFGPKHWNHVVRCHQKLRIVHWHDLAMKKTSGKLRNIQDHWYYLIIIALYLLFQLLPQFLLW